MSGFRRGLAFGVLGIAVGALAQATRWRGADPIADFYSGKSVQLVIGYAPGGGYDVYARALARHMGAPHPGQSVDRGAEHARRGQHQGRELSL